MCQFGGRAFRSARHRASAAGCTGRGVAEASRSFAGFFLFTFHLISFHFLSSFLHENALRAALGEEWDRLLFSFFRSFAGFCFSICFLFIPFLFFFHFPFTREPTGVKLEGIGRGVGQATRSFAGFCILYFSSFLLD
ncbi:hypothetical protein T492DRAFT_12010 [Pavlovales sp. CCMP2436]|nr:hypothetical protein T492DRAFT_12010 [Pavlovales sp. CCMP2436]